MPSVVFFSSRSAIQVPVWQRVRHQHRTDLGPRLRERRDCKLRSAVQGQFGHPGKDLSASFLKKILLFLVLKAALFSPHSLFLPSFHVRSFNNFCQQMKKILAPTSSYVVEGLRPNTEYHFSLAAISNKGTGAFTNEISLKTFQASM